MLALFLLLGASCESPSPASPPSPSSTTSTVSPFTEEAMRAAAIALRTKLCQKMAECDPVRLERREGGFEECVGKNRPLVEIASQYFAHGSALTPSILTQCANDPDLFSTCDAYASVVYESRFLRAPSPSSESCRALFIGTLADGEACANDNQCASGRCVYGGGTQPALEACGQCQARAPIGATCGLDEGGCVTGSVCVPGSPPRCVALGDLGDTCSELSRPCRRSLVCENRVCVAPRPANACDLVFGCSMVPSERDCDPQTLTCEPLPIAGPDEPCGARTGLPKIVCAPTHACALAAGSESLTICKPRIEDDQPCNASAFIESPCLGRGSICIRGTCQRSLALRCNAPPVLP